MGLGAVPVGTGPSATPRNRAAALRTLGIADYFEAVVDTARFQRPKPDPEIFMVAMRDLGLSPRDCWVVEDSLAGIRAARAAGCFTVGTTTTSDAGPVAAAGADMIVESFPELRSALEKL